MTERKEKLTARLGKVRKNIEDTKRLIAYHKKMLKIYQRKETELCDRLEKEQLSDLFKTVKDKGCDIEARLLIMGSFRLRTIRQATFWIEKSIITLMIGK